MSLYCSRRSVSPGTGLVSVNEIRLALAVPRPRLRCLAERADPRFLAMASSKGHIATFDWQAGKLNAEIQLREPVRDIK